VFPGIFTTLRPETEAAAPAILRPVARPYQWNAQRRGRQARAVPALVESRDDSDFILSRDTGGAQNRSGHVRRKHVACAPDFQKYATIAAASELRC
jgi:hypothetical protein